MGFPSVLAAKTQRNTTSSANIVVPTFTTTDVPSPAINDLIVWFVVHNGGNVVSLTWPSTALSGLSVPTVLRANDANGTVIGASIAYTTVTNVQSSYGGFTVTVSGGNVNSAVIGLYVRNWAAVAVSTPVTDISSSANPPSFSPPTGNADYLWLAIGAWNVEDAPTNTPANYTNQVRVNSNDNVTLRRTITIMRRFLTAATEDPGPYTISSSRSVMAYTAAIKGPTALTATLVPAVATTTSVTVGRAKQSVIVPVTGQTGTNNVGQRKTCLLQPTRLVAEAHWLNESPSAPPPSGGAERFDPVLFATRGVIRLRRGVAI